MIRFSLLATDHQARRGTLATDRGDIATPAFMPVASRASVKGLSGDQVRACGADIILVNAYHLMLRPGDEVIAGLGGVHHFMDWKRPILSDSGGYQVFSLAKMRRIDDDGVTFRSHYDGREYVIDPEKMLAVQHNLGVDISMVLDHCPPWPAEKSDVAVATRRTVEWAERSIVAWKKKPRSGGVFAIIQGGMFSDLRHDCTAALIDKDFSGYALGGFSVGEPHGMMCDTLGATMPSMPLEKPRYLMGVGRPADIIAAVDTGIDMFDCVFPTRAGRTGKAFTWRGEENLRNARHRLDGDPIDADCRCPACRHYSRAHLHHLFACREILAAVLLTSHNLFFYQDLMARIRRAIEKGQWKDFARRFRAIFPIRSERKPE